MGIKDIWRAVAAQRMEEPVLAGIWVGRPGVIVTGARGAVVGHLADTLGIGSFVEGVAEATAHRRGQPGAPLPASPATTIPIPDYAYLAVSQTKLGLFTFDRGQWRAKNALRDTIVLVTRSREMALHLSKKGVFYSKLTLLVPGYLPTPLIAPSRLWGDLTRIAHALQPHESSSR